ncbi:MAG: DNA polymerase III subunit alpha, partial [Hoeflea sp.]|nr:DNA polymerase III subunit alpha [Hoeflea sp.]
MARDNKSARLLANLAAGPDQARGREGRGEGHGAAAWPGYVHLRVHSAYSLLEGALPIKTLIKRAVSDDQPALAITDTNNLFGALEFSVKAMEAGIQPLIGCQLDIDMQDAQAGERRSSHRDHLQKAPHIVLYAATPAGYDRLVAIVSQAYLGGETSDRPHIALSWLEEEASGLIALTGAGGGPVDQAMRDGHPDLAKARLERLKAVFGDRLYLELQRQRGYDRAHEARMIALAYACEVPLVAANSAFFPTPDDFEAHDALMAVACNAVMSDDRRPRLSVDNCLKSRAEMIELFGDIPEALASTVEIARRCSAIVESRAPILPRFTGGGEDDPEAALAAEAAELRRQSIEGLERRLARIGMAEGFSETDYRERLKTELDIIESMKFPGYFLIVADFIQWAKGQGIPVGPGRGSGAGSLVAYALTITDVDPLRFSLLFERFLNPARVSMPDFDIDFCQDRRDEVIRYVVAKYGREQVAQIITFGSLQARAALRDVGRVLEMPYGLVDRICKLVPNNPANPTPLNKAIEEEPRFQEEAEKEPAVARLLDIAQKLEGLYRHASTHAAGIVIGDRPLSQLVPMYRDPRSDMPVTQFNMKWVEQAGLVKFDFLGLKTLTVLKTAVDFIAKRGIAIDLEALPL